MDRPDPPDRPHVAQTRVADVLTPVAVDTAYSYRIPAGLDLRPGDFVEVPLGTRETTGVVWEIRDSPGSNLKEIKVRRDLPPVAEHLRQRLGSAAAPKDASQPLPGAPASLATAAS